MKSSVSLEKITKCSHIIPGSPLDIRKYRSYITHRTEKELKLNSKHPCPETRCYLPERAHRLNIPLKKAAKDQILEEKVNEYFKS